MNTDDIVRKADHELVLLNHCQLKGEIRPVAKSSTVYHTCEIGFLEKFLLDFTRAISASSTPSTTICTLVEQVFPHVAS